MARPALALCAVAGLALGLGMAIRGARSEPASIVVAVPLVQPTAFAAPTLGVAPRIVVEPTSVPTTRPTPPPAPVMADQFRLLVDERFAAPTLPWRDEPHGTSWLADGVYHLAPQEAGRFVAVGVPGGNSPGDVVVSGTFRKLAGPSGGGYGLIVRDQGIGARDGEAQDGRFYVFEVGDRGELGVWLRDGSSWIDLLPWTPSDIVRSGAASNELTVSAIGETMSFVVNGIPVASQRDTLLRRGGVGLFAGGDGNSVAVERLTVRVPR
jgi:hypothetical protein